MITKNCPPCLFSALLLISLLIITAAFSRLNTSQQKADPNSLKTAYNKLTAAEKLAILFFETHDFTQLNRQGPDVGAQYRSAIFYQNDDQKKTAQKLVQNLNQKGFHVKTEITPAQQFYPAENYHQDYYQHKGILPYCHSYRKIFD